MKLQFVTSNQTNPFWNVAVENYLVSQPNEDTVTLYLWKNRRTVVVGQNQNPFAECDVDQLLADGGFVMRRTTGGGAVYHDDGNINFSFVAPYALYDQERQFEVVCRAVDSYGLSTSLSGRNDLLCQGRKFSGNAFSKGHFNRLHHGTILIKGNMEDLSRYLKVKPSKLHKHGVQSVASRVVNLSELADVTSDNIVPRLKKAFLEVYGCPDCSEVPFEVLADRKEVKELYARYSSDEWLFGKWRHFQVQRSAQFDWGLVELSVAVDEARGVITDVALSTDALDVTLPEAVQSLLVGVPITTPPAVDEGSPLAGMLADIVGLVFRT